MIPLGVLMFDSVRRSGGFAIRIKQDLQTYVVAAAVFTAGIAAAGSLVTGASTAFSSGSSAAAALGSTASGSVSIAASVRSFWHVEVHVGLALPDCLQHGSLSTSASHEVEFCVVEQVLELLAWLPLNLHVGDVLRRKLVGSLCTLGGEQDREVAQVAPRRIFLPSSSISLMQSTAM